MMASQFELWQGNHTWGGMPFADQHLLGRVYWAGFTGLRQGLMSEVYLCRWVLPGVLRA